MHRFFTRRDFRAWAPCYGVDLVAVLRHARLADRLDALRDWLLMTVWLLLIMALGRLIYPHWLIGSLLATTLVAGVSMLYLVLVRLRVSWRTAVSWIFNRRVPVAGVFLLLVLILAHPAGLRAISVLALAAALAWLAVVILGVVAFMRASKLSQSQAAYRDLTGALPSDVERRATAVSGGNLLVYSRERANPRLGPFVGTGHRIVEWETSLVNVSGRQNDGGVGVRPVDVRALFQQLKSGFEEERVAGRRCQYRLYVDGDALSGWPELFHIHPYGPPRSAVPVDLVLDRLSEPRDYQRAYLCIQETDRMWCGDVITTMLVRAVREEDLLYLAVSAYVLPPVRLSAVPERLVSAAWSGVKASTADYFSLFLGAGLRCGRRLAGRPVAAVTDRLHRHQIRRGAGFDFGAGWSLREHLAMGQSMHYNVLADTAGHLKRLQYRLLYTFGEYLQTCGIDASEFMRETKTIITTVHQNFINQVNGNAITFGENSPATVVGTPPPPPAPETATNTGT